MTPKNISKVACIGMTMKFFKVVSMSVAADVATDDDSRRVFGIKGLPESKAKTAIWHELCPNSLAISRIVDSRSKKPPCW